MILTMKVSLNDAKMWATPNTCSPSLTAGPRVTFSSLGSLVFLLDWKIHRAKVKVLQDTQILLFNKLINVASTWQTSKQFTCTHIP